MGKIKIGKITAPVGLKGEVKIISFSDDPDRFEMLDHVFVAENKHRSKGAAPAKKNEKKKSSVETEVQMRGAAIENVRYKGAQIILKIEGIDDRNASEAARGCELFMDEADLPELEEGEFYVRDMVGAEVVMEDGDMIGTFKDVLTNTAQDVYVVMRKDQKRDLLIPGVPEFIRNVDTEKKRITVRLPEGLLDL